MSKIKCRICNKQIDKSQATQIKPKIYVCCDECKQAYESKGKPTKPVNNVRKELLDYISRICPNTNFVVISSQLKKMMADCPKMTYGGIKYTIWYIANHTSKDVSISPLGLVPYYYDEAANYYKWLRQIKNQIIAMILFKMKRRLLRQLKRRMCLIKIV